MLYDDGKIACDDTRLIIKRYYLWGGSKTIPYSSIRSVKRFSPLGLRRWRLGGSGDFIHWWNWDRRRTRKDVALEINTGKRVRPMITPDDPDTVEEILTRHLSAG